jgi:anhydro-N-acetylmuramic acid kinase
MVYRAMGLMSGSSLDGLDIVVAEFQETGGAWKYEVLAADCYPYTTAWLEKLKGATSLNALDYLLLHTEYGHYTGEMVNRFIEAHNLQYKVQLIASHGHTTFHMPSARMTAQLGDGAAIAATTGINVVSDLRAINVALGGQGAPIVPIGEKLLFNDYRFFLNIGGIANISCHTNGQVYAFDICPANRVLNMLANEVKKPYDDKGEMAAGGKLLPNLLRMLNELEYYSLPYPKSLANDFGTDVVYPLARGAGIKVQDALRTVTEHIAVQTARALQQVATPDDLKGRKLLITGGGAHNAFLVSRISAALQEIGVEAVVPDTITIDFKEALIMALIGILRWREENNVLASVTGASRDSIGGAVWIGQEA